jgi:hypothetical protein
VQELPGVLEVRQGQEATPDELRREMRELREDLTLLRLAQDRLANVAMLNAELFGRGIIGYEGPARFDLPHAIVCEHCRSPVDGLGYELRLSRGRAYLCKECFDEATR